MSNDSEERTDATAEALERIASRLDDITEAIVLYMRTNESAIEMLTSRVESAMEMAATRIEDSINETSRVRGQRNVGRNAEHFGS